MTHVLKCLQLSTMQNHDPNSPAIVHHDSTQTFSYGSLLRDVACAKEHLLKETGKTEDGIAGQRIAFMVENSYDYAGAQQIGIDRIVGL